VSAAFAVRLADSDGVSARVIELDLGSLGAATDHPYDITRYFLETAGAVLLPLTRLVLKRARPDGVSSAARLMRAAYEGRHPRRAPIAARPYSGDDFLVEDGNSTVLNAIASGWPDILAVVVG